MNQIITLTKRHIKNYLRDKTSVFFSFLSVIILLAIYMLFLGKQFSNIPELNAIQNTLFMIGYIMGGALVVNTITLSLGVISIYVTDQEQKKLDGFFVTPVKRYNLVISYFLSTFIITLTFTLMMFLITLVYILVKTGFMYSLSSLLTIFGLLIICVLISTPIMIFIASFIKSNSAFSTVASIVGTAVGFITGIYIPLSMLDSVTRNIASVLPFSHMTIKLRNAIIGSDVLSKLPIEAKEALSLTDLKIFNISVSINIVLMASLLVSVLLITLAYFKMIKKNK